MKRISQSPNSPVMRVLHTVEWAGLLLISIMLAICYGHTRMPYSE